MKNLIVIISCAIFSLSFCISCATSSSSAAYRPAGSTSAAWQVQGKWNSGSGLVTITVNGSEVISGKIGLGNTSKTLEGNYEGHKITAILTRGAGWFMQEKMHCVVTVDGEVAATFEW